MRVDRHWILGMLAASLLTNLFLVGVLTGRVLNKSPSVPGAGGLAPAARVRLLPPSEQAAFVKAMAPHRPSIRQTRLVQRAARALVEADIRSDPLNRAQLSSDLARLREAQERQQTEIHAGLVDALTVLSPAARRALTARAQTLEPTQ